MIKSASNEEDIARLVDQYVDLREKLKKLGVLRSDRTIQSDYAEWLVARRLRLRLADNAVQAGYDATDSRNRKYQIKARRVSSLSSSTSFDFRSIKHPFDFLVGVFLDGRLKVLGIIKVERQDVRDLCRPNRSGIRLRWNRESAADPRIVRVYWPEESD